MALDRDLNVAVVSAWGLRSRVPLSGWEMLAATGVRGLRVAVESGRFSRLELTEANPEAFEVLRDNVARSALAGARAIRWDARRALERSAFDYVDLDPYGSPLEFLDPALDALRPGGLLAVTATDLRVLGGADREAARRRYHGEPVRGRLGPEGGLRLLLAELARRAGSRGRRLEVLLAYVGGHHLRAYVSLADGPPAAAGTDVSLVDSATWSGPPLGPEASYGPMWLGPLLDPSLVNALGPPTTPSDPGAISALLARLKEEAGVDRPFYYEPNTLAGELQLREPPSLAALMGRLSEEGFRCARTAARVGAFRTTAPYDRVVAAVRRVTA